MRSIAALALVVGLLSVGAPAGAVESTTKGAPRFAITGSGDALVNVPRTYKPVIVSATHQGKSNFIISGIGRDGESESWLVNEIGPYSGTVLVDTASFSGFSQKNPIVALEIKADGEWTVRTRPLAAAPRARQGTGVGDQVVKLRMTVGGLKKITLEHSGAGNFIVEAVDRKGGTDLLVNEIGEYSGGARVPAGTRFLSVRADGEWSFSII
ncbi:MAG: hypothetical protein GKR85_08005 [Candidatus Nanopelagicales bacterium]|nr:hypothetical protein [Candidatus Nanopelagicales bacterium]